jgi:hypothetical protein
MDTNKVLYAKSELRKRQREKRRDTITNAVLLIISTCLYNRSMRYDETTSRINLDACRTVSGMITNVKKK